MQLVGIQIYNFTTNSNVTWNRIEVIQKIPGQHTGRARSKETTENGHIEHRTRYSESTNVKLQNIQHGK